MKTILTFLLCLLIFSGCENDIQYPQVTEEIESDWICEDYHPVRNYAMDCIRETGQVDESKSEDWIYLCKKLAIRLHCKKELFKVTYIQYKKNHFKLETARELLE